MSEGRVQTVSKAALLKKLGEDTFALFGRGTLPVPTVLRPTYDALCALETPKTRGGRATTKTKRSKGP